MVHPNLRVFSTEESKPSSLRTVEVFGSMKTSFSLLLPLRVNLLLRVNDSEFALLAHAARQQRRIQQGP